MKSCSSSFMKEKKERGTRYAETETFAFDGMLSLPELDSSHQMLSNIAPCSFHGLRVLKALNVSYNMLSVLSQNTLCGLQHLAVLDLRGNDIIYVPPFIIHYCLESAGTGE